MPVKSVAHPMKQVGQHSLITQSLFSISDNGNGNGNDENVTVTVTVTVTVNNDGDMFVFVTQIKCRINTWAPFVNDAMTRVCLLCSLVRSLACLLPRKEG
jgi:hypothetical protein